ncbi:glycosyl hydrolase family 28-related protein [Ktedonospora formicarum]|uniref:Mycodextranase n=1 Tax=Ktedonospora formicarum TaxID=2778364 RepID=A0A8J3I8X2_9CHLR|nr:glycosyl hydrolase family 28-related protein [Ktedonospora formicarum]GHO48990.1 mycodextranase [Ktedonospora formicarum]
MQDIMRTRRKKRLAGFVALLLLVSAFSLVVPFPRSAASAATTSRVTVAAIDPSLVAGRGAQLGIIQQEAENATTNGTILPFDTSAYTLSGEASGRQAVQLRPGQYVAFTLTQRANAVTIRYAIPDAPTGGGIDAPLIVSVNHNGRENTHPQTITLTSKYSWLYNQYPFTNDPNADLLHPDWWITECSCVPASTTPPPTITKPFRPMHFYDEQRLLLHNTYQAGDVVRLSMPAGSNVAWMAIDLADFQQVAGPVPKPKNSVSVTNFGADPSGIRDSSDAFDHAIRVAKASGKKVYIPVGIFQVDRHIIVDNITVEGAGSWWSIVKGHQVTLTSPAPDGSVHTGVGFYGKYTADGGSRNVHLSNFAIEGDVQERIDTDQVNGIGGALNDSTIDGVYIHHTKVGIWLDGPMHNVMVENTVITDQIADGINFHQGVTTSRVVNSLIRNTGDDGLAMWSEAMNGQPTIEDANNVFDHNTVQNPVLANGIAIYGGHNNTVSNNIVADPVREGSGLHAGSRFGSTPFAGYLRFTNNTTVRAGSFELNWKIGLGAIWLYALEGSLTTDIEVTGDNFLQSTYNAIMIVSDFPVKDLYSISNVHFRDIHVDGTGTSVLSARAAGNATFQNVVARNVGAVGINNCGSFHFTLGGSEFKVTDLSGNTGGGATGPWLAPWELPNTITCNDQPPVVPPPPPFPW